MPLNFAVPPAIREEIKNASPRAVGVIGGSLLESSLESALRRRMKEHHKASSELFRPSGPLGTFSAKINLGLVTGMYGQKTYRDLLIIKDVRNRFAHDLKHLHFGEQGIAAKCMNLVTPEIYLRDPALDELPASFEGWKGLTGLVHDVSEEGEMLNLIYLTHAKRSILSTPQRRFETTVELLSVLLEGASGASPPDSSF